MPVDLVLIATIMARQRFPVPSFLASSKEFFQDKNLLSATKDLTYSKKKLTRLMHACTEGNLLRAAALINAKADVNAVSLVDHLTPLMFAADNGHTEIVRLLLDARANPNVSMNTMDYDTPLLMATRWGDLELIKLLLHKGAFVNAINKNGVTPLASASDTGYVDMVELLIQSGADVNASRFDDHFTPLLYACQGGHVEAARVLLENKAEVNSCSIHRATPLMWAAVQGHEELCRLLIKWGADLNARCIWGKTALMMATESGHTEIVKLLTQIEA
jgi:ankyrin repeat protein